MQYVIREQSNDRHIQVNVGKWVVINVTGITKAPAMFGNITQAKYTFMADPNELGQAFGNNYEKFALRQDKKAFQLYDDGWRAAK